MEGEAEGRGEEGAWEEGVWNEGVGGMGPRDDVIKVDVEGEACGKGEGRELVGTEGDGEDAGGTPQGDYSDDDDDDEMYDTDTPGRARFPRTQAWAALSLWVLGF